ncbi:glycosyltransferase [Nonomuraea candida]|uniref:glycosyltransferase n=1 Tax=Nonomuraea candida TaxID=359159 RepID=UPI0006938700|nr:glycosyltransferase [Nonomuraea candida]
MTRIAAVLVRQHMAQAAPPGVDPGRFLTAIAEDTYEMVAGLELVTPVLITSVPGLDDIVWPGTEVITVDEHEPLKAILGRLRAEQAAVIAADAPDLPPLLVGKLFRELGRAEVTICPAEGGGAVALACALPAPAWADPDLNAHDVVKDLRAQAPGPRRVATTPGWHRLRAPADLERLDPGLEGWDNTRALLRAE